MLSATWLQFHLSRQECRRVIYVKRVIVASILLSLLLLLGFYLLHLRCIDYMYSLFSLVEYFLVIAVMAYHIVSPWHFGFDQVISEMELLRKRAL